MEWSEMWVWVCEFLFYKLGKTIDRGGGGGGEVG